MAATKFFSSFWIAVDEVIVSRRDGACKRQPVEVCCWEKEKMK
jgi:hypothetical protein